MGFPHPWPTEWPEPPKPMRPAPATDRPEDPMPTEPPPEEPDPATPNPADPDPAVPEYRTAFYAVTWAVNHLCNLRCTHCYDVVAERRHDLGPADALGVVGRLNDAGVRFIAFSGGEAFLRADLFDLMAECGRRGMAFGARSNGTRITPAVARRLSDLGIAVVGVSFDGATAATHDAVRGAGAFAAALAGVRNLAAAGVRAQMEVVLSRSNAPEALDFIALGEAAGAAEVNFSAMTPQGRGGQRAADLLDHGLWSALTDSLRRAAAIAPVRITPNCALTGPCVANIQPHVTCDGWMTPCYLSPVKLFNVLQVPPESFRECLRGSRGSYLDVCGRRSWTHLPESRRVALSLLGA